MKIGDPFVWTNRGYHPYRVGLVKKLSTRGVVLSILFPMEGGDYELPVWNEYYFRNEGLMHTFKNYPPKKGSALERARHEVFELLFKRE